MDRLIDRQIIVQMDRQIGKWTETRMDGLSHRATASHTYRWTGRQADIQMIGRQMDRQKSQKMDRSTETMNRQINGKEDILTNRPIII